MNIGYYSVANKKGHLSFNMKTDGTEEGKEVSELS